MKAAIVLALLCVAGCLLIPFPFSRYASVSASPSPSPQGPGNVYCASDNGGRVYCPIDVRGGVQLTRQRSDSPCIFNRTWGFDRRGVWVDRGCRAEFSSGYVAGPGPGPGPGPGRPGWPGWGQGYNIYCASDDGRRNWCPVDTRGGIQMIRQRSDSPCIFGSTWGTDRKGVWVDRGCRADFQIGQAGWQPDQKTVIYCASDDGGRNFCNANTGQGVRIVRQRSDSDCIYNRTWGYERRRIWVDRGCRADFEVGGRFY